MAGPCHHFQYTHKFTVHVYVLYIFFFLEKVGTALLASTSTLPLPLFMLVLTYSLLRLHMAGLKVASN